MPKKKTYFKSLTAIGGIIFLATLVLCLFFYIWLGHSKNVSAKEKILSTFPVPLGYTNGQAIWSNELTFKTKLAKALDYPVNFKNTMETLVIEKKIFAVAKKISQLPSDYELRTEYSLLGKTEKEYLLNTKNISEKDFIYKILKPVIIQRNLKIWYNKQVQLNSASYEKIQTIKAQLDRGSNFSKLAENYNEDKHSQPLKGDLGFLGREKLLPELWGELDSVNIGETKQIISRHGLHFIKVINKDNQGSEQHRRLHIQQIFIAMTGFETWLRTEAAKQKTLLIVNFKN